MVFLAHWPLTHYRVPEVKPGGIKPALMRQKQAGLYEFPDNQDLTEKSYLEKPQKGQLKVTLNS